MQNTLICKLNGLNGSLPPATSPSFIYKLSPKTLVTFVIESRSPILTEDTALIVSLWNGVDTVPQQYNGVLNLSEHWNCEVAFNVPGNYSFWIEYIDNNGEKSRGIKNWIVVDPEIKISGKILPINGICMQSVLPRCCGEIERWYEIFSHQKELGYNMFHAAPLQEFGPSGSHYSLYDPNMLNSGIFRNYDNEEEKIEALGGLLNRLDNEGAGFIIDIVLNHLSPAAPFFEKHPNGTWNLTTAPHLKSAFELDAALQHFSKSLANGQKPKFRKNIIENSNDVEVLLKMIRNDVIKKLKIQEFFHIDEEKAKNDFINNQSEEEIVDKEKLKLLHERGLEWFIKKYALLHEGEGKFLTRINPDLIWKACRSLKFKTQDIIEIGKKAIKTVNSNLHKRSEKFIEDIMKNLTIEIRQKIGQEITESNPIIKPCFHRLINGDSCVYNGYVNGYKKVHKDFADKSGWHYLRRNVIVWNDCIKLRYGYKKEDCPVVWDLMEKYIASMAKIFKGFRLDNAHSTPIHVSEYLLAKARELNPNILITAELFTEDINTDAKYVKRLGLNLLIREAIHCPDLSSMGNSIFQYSNGEISNINTPIATTYQDDLTFIGFSPEIPRWESTPIPALFYDCTHDNDPPAKKRTLQDSLPHAFLTAFTNCAISSNRGYDEFIPKNLSVVSEKRLYSPPDYSSQAIPEVTAIDFIEEPIKVYVEYSVGGRYKEVSIYGEWDNWTKKINLMPIDKHKWGVILLFPKDYNGKEMAYKYMVDKKWAYDQRLKTVGRGTKINNLLSVDTTIKAFPGIYENLYCARKFINWWHREMAEKRFDRIFVNQYSEDMMMVVRKNLENEESYVLIARSAFKHKSNKIDVKGIRLPGCINTVEFIGILYVRKARFEEDKKFINGLSGMLDIFTNFEKFSRVVRDPVENVDVIDLIGIPQAFVLVLKVKV